MIYQFAFHERVKPTPPDCEAGRLHALLEQGQQLSREQKNRLAYILWGIFGAQSSTYRLGGWAFSFSEFLPQILVKQWDSWQEYHAPDKSSLRRVLYGKVQQMVASPD